LRRPEEKPRKWVKPDRRRPRTNPASTTAEDLDEVGGAFELAQMLKRRLQYRRSRRARWRVRYLGRTSGRRVLRLVADKRRSTPWSIVVSKRMGTQETLQRRWRSDIPRPRSRRRSGPSHRVSRVSDSTSGLVNHIDSHASGLVATNGSFNNARPHVTRL